MPDNSLGPDARRRHRLSPYQDTRWPAITIAAAAQALETRSTVGLRPAFGLVAALGTTASPQLLVPLYRPMPGGGLKSNHRNTAFARVASGLVVGEELVRLRPSSITQALVCVADRFEEPRPMKMKVSA